MSKKKRRERREAKRLADEAAAAAKAAAIEAQVAAVAARHADRWRLGGGSALMVAGLAALGALLVPPLLPQPESRPLALTIASEGAGDRLEHVALLLIEERSLFQHLGLSGRTPAVIVTTEITTSAPDCTAPPGVSIQWTDGTNAEGLVSELRGKEPRCEAADGGGSSWVNSTLMELGRAPVTRRFENGGVWSESWVIEAQVSEGSRVSTPDDFPGLPHRGYMGVKLCPSCDLAAVVGDVELTRSNEAEGFVTLDETLEFEVITKWFPFALVNSAWAAAILAVALGAIALGARIGWGAFRRLRDDQVAGRRND